MLTHLVTSTIIQHVLQRRLRSIGTYRLIFLHKTCVITGLICLYLDVLALRVLTPGDLELISFVWFLLLRVFERRVLWIGWLRVCLSTLIVLVLRILGLLQHNLNLFSTLDSNFCATFGLFGFRISLRCLISGPLLAPLLIIFHFKQMAAICIHLLAYPKIDFDWLLC